MAADDKNEPTQPRQSGDLAPASQENENRTASVSRNEKEDVTANHAEQGLEVLKGEDLPSREAPLEALGIPNWRELEKKIVHRLDSTLMPCLIVLYLFNYLDRASIA